ncbi:hypothetical protein BFL36_05010 [Clavibacter michiganensis]|uniref:Uncharacterized protein n=1 Tax=Clavibacter michiganensis TaxID=28447 RepID=A0A251YMP2_9MICO|nr:MULTISPECIES: hypothetical protein [Clavibacter]OUE08144.1 hypothetical protein CMsap09_04280 [Clavibacter michiganensis]OUE25419.1 hypothetical protein BFL36_05010 [Clavibacter michiganensis]
MPLGPNGTDPKKPTTARYALWIIVGGIAVVMIGQGVYGILT